jgi:uncharacterized RDD family membrane protein YckC
MNMPPGGSDPDQQQPPWPLRNSPPHPYPPLPASAVVLPGYAPGGYDPTSVVGTRIVQYLLDVLLWLILMVIEAMIMGFLISTLKDRGTGGLAWVLLLFFSVVCASMWFVFAWWPSIHGGQTPAMKWLKLRIVTEQGGKPTLGALTIRWLLLLLVDVQVFGVGLIVMSSSPRHQRIGDMAAKTLVVRTHPPAR